MIQTTYYTNDEVIKAIMSLYEIDQFDLDCTYSKGVFWKNITPPIWKTDLSPQHEDVMKSNSEKLPFLDGSIKSTMYDPPFVIAGGSYKGNKEGSSIIAKRFEGYKNFEELKSNYYNTLKELYRITDDGGYVVMKTQDTVSGGKNHFTHVAVMNMALEIGFHPRDMFILLAKHRLSSFNGTKWKKQYHARKFHSYFWVFQKVSCKVNYMYDYLDKTETNNKIDKLKNVSKEILASEETSRVFLKNAGLLLK